MSYFQTYLVFSRMLENDVIIQLGSRLLMLLAMFPPSRKLTKQAIHCLSYLVTVSANMVLKNIMMKYFVERQGTAGSRSMLMAVRSGS